MQQNFSYDKLPSYLRPFDAATSTVGYSTNMHQPPTYYHHPHGMLPRCALTPTDSTDGESPISSPIPSNFSPQLPHFFRPIDFDSCSKVSRSTLPTPTDSCCSDDNEPAPLTIVSPSTGIPRPDNSGITVTLLDKDLWDSFRTIGNEMIVTKPGRRMFPCLLLSIRGLPKMDSFSVSLRFTSADQLRYKFLNRRWVPMRESEVLQNEDRQTFLHPASPTTGQAWMKKPICFKQVKITHNSKSRNGNILLYTMHKYVMELVVKPADADDSHAHIIPIPETTFMAVTSYQNVKLTQLKIDNNPYAKGFRDRAESAASMMAHPPPVVPLYDHQSLWQMPPPSLPSSDLRYKQAPFPGILNDVPSHPFYTSTPLRHLSPPTTSMMPQPVLPCYHRQMAWPFPPRSQSRSTTASPHSYSADCSDLEDY